MLALARVGMTAELSIALVRLVVLCECMKATKPLALLVATSTSILLRRKSPTLPVLSLVWSLVMVTERDSLTLTWKVVLHGDEVHSVAEEKDDKNEGINAETASIDPAKLILTFVFVLSIIPL